ncbi:MAG: type II toxin-antitoxin system RelE/ParE family toxin [Candidatus Azotimanducaceae bacterium WSBS_2022_MAG_OTU7]
MAVEFGWPCGKPLCKKLKNSDDLREVRTDLPGKRITRVFFYVSGREMVLLHGFIKKSQKTPPRDLNLGKQRMKEHQRHG